MIIEFKTTNKNTYGRRHYLGIDTDKNIFSRNSSRMIIEGIEIKTRDYRDLITKLKNEGLREVEYI